MLKAAGTRLKRLKYLLQFPPFEEDPGVKKQEPRWKK
jgi:hypothetical protein